MNLLLLCLNNQTSTESIEEDRVNKPWRPLPSQRTTAERAKQLMLVAIPATLLLSAAVGAIFQTLVLMVLNLWYNDWGGGEKVVPRNFINAVGFICYTSASLEILLGSSIVSCAPLRWQWLGIIWVAVFFTVHLQDLRDQLGDRLRGRPTLPLLIGDCHARWTILVPLVCLSVLCPMFWQLGLLGYVLPVTTGGLITTRLLTQRTAAADRMTFKIWSLWLMSIYLLPLITRWQHREN
jgi:4-hydroxybenzoate polyprenyltransferase